MRLGIDIGTCFSSAAFVDGETLIPIKDPIGLSYSVPTSVFVTPQKQILVGKAANDRRVSDPTCYRRELKRDLGKRPLLLGGQPYLPEVLITSILGKIKHDADIFMTNIRQPASTGAVLTIPATYPQFKHGLMLKAAVQAGFGAEEVSLLEEPVAAAFYYAQKSRMSEGEILLVYDLGGGTFDAALLQKRGAGFEYLALPAGIERCGGVDFDRAIYNDLISQHLELQSLLQSGRTDKAALITRIYIEERCIDLKHQLSETEEAEIFFTIPGLGNLVEYGLTRSTFNRMIAPYIQDTLTCCQQMLQQANITAEKITRILLVGGSCRIPYIQEVLQQEFKCPINGVLDLELVVCQGAALYATTYKIHGNKTIIESSTAMGVQSHHILLSEEMQYRNAKVVLVGETGVGKSGLALVLTGQPFVATPSTHGRHVWQLEQQEVQLEKKKKETREVLLWDLAGQRDYRLIHQLHLHEATVALIVFDADRETDPLAGIRYWHRVLRLAQQARREQTLPLTIFLVAARIDRGGTSVSRRRIETLLNELGCASYIETSAQEGRGIVELRQAIRVAIDWTALPSVTSTRLLQDIKTFVPAEQRAQRILRSADDLYDAFLHSPVAPAASNELRQQFETALGRLEAHGTIRKLGFGNLILLQPEKLDDYASALVIAAKAEPDGLGSLSEDLVQQGRFSIPKQNRLVNPSQEQLLLIAMIDEMVRHELVLREGGMLLFPSQSKREHPDRTALTNRQTVTFTFAGPVLSIYTTVVVRLARSDIFHMQELWQHTVIYTAKHGGTYGLLLIFLAEDRAEMGLFFDEGSSEEMRLLFEDFVKTHLERYAPGTVLHRRICICPECGETFTEKQINNRRTRGFSFIRCTTCETEITLSDGKARSIIVPASQIQKMDEAADRQRDRDSAAALLQGKIAMQDFDVFLCYHEADKPTVKQIGEQLKQHGILPWLDEWELRPGLPWQRTLEEKIQSIKSALVLVSASGIGPWQHFELQGFLREFVSRGCPVIPVLLPDAPPGQPVLPVFLKSMTWVDFRKQEPDPMHQLLWGITGKRRGSDLR